MLTRGRDMCQALAGLILIVTLAVTSANAADQPVAGHSGEKFSVTDPASLHRLVANGARVVQDYGAFTVVQAPATADVALPGVDALPLENYVLLNAGPIDTAAPAATALRAPRGSFTGKVMHLIQFAGPVRPEWVDAIEHTNVEIITPIPSNAYLVYGDANAIAALQGLAAREAHIQWDGAYLDAYRINPEAGALMNPAAGVQSHLLAIQLVIDPVANRETLNLIDKIKSAPIVEKYEILNYVDIIVDLPTARINDLAARPDVVSIGYFDTPRKWDERQAQIVAGNISGNSPVLGTGYLAWLTSRGFTQAQFTASNFAVDVTDSGIDDGTTAPNHFGLYVNGVLPGTSRIVYNRLVGTPNSGSTLKGCDGHGTLNTHVIGGYNTVAGSPHTDAAGFHYGLGIAPFVKMGSSVIFDPNSYTNPNVATLISMAYTDNARISSNSWGNTSGNTYNTIAQSYDTLVRDAQSGTAGNQQMTIVFAAGNSGSGANTVHPPATAKNLICVGATENVQSFGATADGCGYGDGAADSLNDMATYSSRGPCSDGRKKPDIVAPGTHVTGGVVQTDTPGATGQADACFISNGNGVCGGSASSNFFPVSGQQFYTSSTGTSHSTPCVAGGCALVRQFFINQSLAVPSPSMTKGFLMNSARYITGTGANDTLWSNSQGMGEMNLGEAFNRLAVTPTVIRDEVAADMFTATGQTRVFTGNIADSTKPFRVTLAWTDAPGPTTGSAFLNNLNLTVVVGGSTYLGNVFTGANSTTGGSADAANNVESVFRPSGASGAYTVTVTAANISANGVPGNASSLDQDFSLVIYNGTAGCGTLTLSPATLPAGNVGLAYSQTITTTGGTAPYTYSLLSGTLPTGLGLSSAGVLSGTPTVGGSSNFTVQATDSAGCPGTKAYSLAICSTMTIAPPTLPNAQVGAAYSQTLSTSGGVAPYTWVVFSGALPDGLSLSTSGDLTGTPTSAATSSVVLRVTDALGCTMNKPYTIVACGNISISPAALPNGTVGTLYGQTLSASGGLAPYNWTLDSGSLPGGLGLSGAGSLSGTPGTGGNFTFAVRATDSNGCSNTSTYTVQVCPVLTINPASLPAGIVGSAYSQFVSDNGGTAPYFFAIGSGSLPSGLSLSLAGLISGTPTAVGSFNFTIETADSTPAEGTCTTSAAYSISVTCPTVTVLPATLPNGTVGAIYNQTLSGSGGTAPYVWSVSSGAVPTGLTLSSGGLLSGSPTASGTFNFTAQATDNFGCPGSRTYAIAICPITSIDPPLLPGGTVGISYSQFLIASGGTAPYSFSVSAGALPPGLTLDVGGTLSGSPTTAGPYNFTASTTDHFGCTGSREYSIGIDTCPAITITPANLPNGLVGIPYSQTLSPTGGTAPHNFTPLTPLPAGLTLSAAGLLAGTPLTAGGNNFTIRVTDDIGCTGDQPFTLTVGNCPAITFAPPTLPNGLTGIAYNQTLTPSGGTAPYAIAITVGTLPAGLTLTPEGLLSGTPTSSGPETFTVQASDAAGCTGTQEYTLTIGSCPAIDLLPAVLPPGTFNVAYSQTLTATGGSPPFNWSVSLGALPAGLTLGPASGDISGTPTAGGVFNFTVVAHDSLNCTGNLAYSLTIGGAGCALPGDLNADSQVDGLDIQPFVDCLVSGSSLLGTCNCGDFNASTLVDQADVNPFVAALMGP